MKLILDEQVIREVIDTLNMARTTLLGITKLDSPQEVAKKSSKETAITRRMSRAIDIIQQSEQPEVDLHNNGWIDCRKQMPKETKQWSDTLQGHREWTESALVLAWDSMYGCRVDATKNGKWMSEQRGGYTGQVVHGIIAWRPIPKFNEELLLNTRKEK